MVDASGRVQRVAQLLRKFPENADAAWAAGCLETWLHHGGRLDSLMGLAPRQGGAYDVPARAEPIRRRNAALLELAANLTEKNKASTIVAMKRASNPLILRIEAEAGPVPESASQIKRILRTRV